MFDTRRYRECLKVGFITPRKRDYFEFLDEIDALRAELDERKVGEEYLVRIAGEQQNTIQSLYEERAVQNAELATVTKERDAAVADLQMVCTQGEPCAACRHCCNMGDQFPCEVSSKWCGGTAWAYRGARR